MAISEGKYRTPEVHDLHYFRLLESFRSLHFWVPHTKYVNRMTPSELAVYLAVLALSRHIHSHNSSHLCCLSIVGWSSNARTLQPLGEDVRPGK